MKKVTIIYILLLIVCSLQAQTLETVEIKGIVLDENGMELPGATTYLKDRTTGTFTDMDGKFSLKANVGDVLIVSMIGYKRFEHLIVKEEQNMVVKLQTDDLEIDDVVVTAMGATQRKISLVGAITNVDVTQLQKPATSITNMLGGRVPGIITRQNSGEPGKNISEFWIRGIGTFGANSSALVLVDGLEGDLSSLDPADIESFTVLKDASATAVYGVRGANGVVLVTTKRGTSDKLNITFRANTTISYLTRMPEYVRAYDYALLANEANLARGDKALYDQTELELIRKNFDPDLYPDVNWRDEILRRTSFQHTYYVSARGGGSLARYFISLGMSNESAAYKQDKTSKYRSDVGYNTYNYRANIDMNLTKTTNLYFGVDGYISRKTEPGNANTDYLWSAQSKLTPLTIPTVYSNGYLPAYGTAGDEYSPYIMLNHTGISTQDNAKHNVTLALNQDFSPILKGLTARAQLAVYQEANQFEQRHITPDMYYATGRDYKTGELKFLNRFEKVAARYFRNQYVYKKYHFESTINYSTIVNKDHRFSGLLYYYMNETKANFFQDGGSTPSSMDAVPLRYQGLSGRVSYGLKDTYFVDVNFGYTGSENFEPGKQFGFFPSVAAGWVPTSYDFVRSGLPWLDFFKIRASYGLVGNDRISDRRFPYLTIVNDNTSAGWGSSSPGIQEQTVGADNLAWEKAKKFDVGIEGRLLNEKIDFVVDIFNDQRDGIFQERAQIPEYVGLTNLPFGNVGRMKSYGADGNISFTQTLNENMSFVVRANFTYSKNKIQEWEQAFPKYGYQESNGWPHNVRRGYIAEGLFKDEADVASSPVQTFGSYLPGDIKYRDVNGDGKINSDDQVPLSYDNYPRLMYGFGGEFQYKNLTIGVLFRGVGNNDFYYTSEASGMGYIPFLNGQLGNVLKIVNDPSNRWIPREISDNPATENPNARFPRLSYGGNGNNSQVSTFWKGNSKYLRLQEISIGYNLKLKKLASIGINSVDLQFVGTDLYVWDKIKEWDPEQARYNGRAYPIPARYAFQLYVNF